MKNTEKWYWTFKCTPRIVRIRTSSISITLSRLWNSGSRPQVIPRRNCCHSWKKLVQCILSVYHSPFVMFMKAALHSLDYLYFTFLCEMAFKNFVEAISDSPTIHDSQYIDRIEHIFERQNHVVLRAPSIRSWRVSSPLPDLSKRLKIFSKNFLQANQQNQNYRHAMSAIMHRHSEQLSTPQTANTLCLQPGALFGKT